MYLNLPDRLDLDGLTNVQVENCDQTARYLPAHNPEARASDKYANTENEAGAHMKDCT